MHRNLSEGDNRRGRPAIRCILGEYVFQETLGQGAYGKVKLATNRQTGHKVAVKIIRMEKITNIKAHTKVRREIAILRTLRHPHIIRLYDVIFTPSDIFLVMEYLPGGELFDFLIHSGRLCQPLARRFFQQILCAVEFMHHFRVIHRDLKPENLLMDLEDNVKIADFGLSNITDDGKFLHTSCGSPNYAAPEVIMGRLYMGPEVDIWSCGVILYVMLVGRLPFDEDTIPALFAKIKEGSYPPPSFLPPAARDLIACMLVVDPMHRITIPEIRENPWFLEDLPEYLATPVQTPNPPPTTVEVEPDMLLVMTESDTPPSARRSAGKAGPQRLSRAMAIPGSGAPFDSPTPAASSAPANFSSQGHSGRLPPRRIDGSQPKLVASPLMTAFMTDSTARVRESYNEPSSVGHSPSLLGSILSSTPTNTSFAGSMKDYLGPRVSDPIGIPRPTADVGCSPMSFPSLKDGGMLPPSPALSHLATAMALHQGGGGLGQRGGSLVSNASSAEAPVVEIPVHKNWRLGLFTEVASNVAMRAIYDVLRVSGFVWKVFSPYHLMASQHPGKSDVAIGIQLYRMQERHDKGYLVDFYVLGSAVLPAVDHIHQLYLRVNTKIGA